MQSQSQTGARSPRERQTSLFLRRPAGLLVEKAHQLAVQFSASPVKYEIRLFFPERRLQTPGHVLLLGQGKSLLSVIKAAAVRTGRNGVEKLLVVSEQFPVSQIEIVEPGGPISAQRVVKGASRCTRFSQASPHSRRAGT